jgi:molybdopterin-guanine dinucleotide biosynthesis protein A
MSASARPRAAVVLAGGRSTRMGSPKAELDWHGSPLLRRVVGVLARVVEPVVVVVAPGQRLPDLPPGVEVAVDATPGRGPLEGIAAGLRALGERAGVAFVSSTDAPLLHPAFVRRVLDLLGDADVALPRVEGRNHPLAAAYRTALLPHVEALLAADRLRPAFLFEAVRTRVLEADDLLRDARLAAVDPGLASVRNVNTPQEYRAAAGEPEPEVLVEWFGPLRRARGVACETVRAATLGAAIRRLDAGASLDHALLAINGEQFQRDPGVPLVRGDRLAVVPAEAGG